MTSCVSRAFSSRSSPSHACGWSSVSRCNGISHKQSNRGLMTGQAQPAPVRHFVPHNDSACTEVMISAPRAYRSFLTTVHPNTSARYTRSSFVRYSLASSCHSHKGHVPGSQLCRYAPPSLVKPEQHVQADRKFLNTLVHRPTQRVRRSWVTRPPQAQCSRSTFADLGY